MPSGVRIEGLSKVLAELKEKTTAIQNNVDRELTAGAEAIATMAKQLAPVYEGRIKQAIIPDTREKLHKEVTCNIYYAPYIEFGTGRKIQIPAGLEAIAAQFKNQAKRGSFDDMVKALAEWVRKKGLAGTYSVKTQRRTGNKANRANEDMQVAYLIARSILRNGMKAHPFFFPAYFSKKDGILQNVKRMVNE